MISRRRFLRTTLLGSALLGGAVLVGKQIGGYAVDAETARALRTLTPKELTIFLAAARRIALPDRADAPTLDDEARARSLALFVDRYLARLDAGTLGDLRALFALLEHGSGPLVLSATRFTRMSDAAKDAVLADWEASRLTVRRRGFQALRTLTFLGFYRDDHTWPLLGYSGPLLPGAPR